MHTAFDIHHMLASHAVQSASIDSFQYAPYPELVLSRSYAAACWRAGGEGDGRCSRKSIPGPVVPVIKGAGQLLLVNARYGGR